MTANTAGGAHTPAGQPTPGPWYVSEYKGDGVHNIFLCAKHSMMVLADLNSVHIDSPANARLIAAAPDLLEALEEVSHYFFGEHHYDHPTAVKIRAALSRAVTP